jgi:hypothetical protein
LVERAAGNPFFLEELALANRSGEDPAQNLPETVQAVMEARVARLEPRLRELLYAIAIIGPRTPVDLVARLLSADPQAVAADSEHLINSGFLTEGEDGLAFRHMLLHDTAYAMISPRDRAGLHGKLAHLLETEGESTLPETLALHWQEAGERTVRLTAGPGPATLHSIGLPDRRPLPSPSADLPLSTPNIRRVRTGSCDCSFPWPLRSWRGRAMVPRMSGVPTPVPMS